METIIAVLAGVMFLAAAVTFGADSRDSNDWSWHPRP
jgi:hypothetical protein